MSIWTRGGAIVDLRPYVAKVEQEVGIGSKNIHDASYPFIIQEKYRAGYFTHYAGEGTLRSAKVSYKGEEADLALCRSKARFSQKERERILTLEPVEIEFSDLSFKIQTVISFEENTGVIKTERKVYDLSNPDAVITIDEYLVGCYGTTEYTQDMSELALSVDDEKIDYEYKCREIKKAEAKKVKCKLPPIETVVSMSCQAESYEGYIKEGYAFSPMFTLGYRTKVKNNQEVETWLKLEKLT
ncbi:MAG TPA: hypothetical protein PLI19_01130 [Erysipelotrichaceae bacterium]|nr:hypothetical protein [Erysipelotrichaceae bacterium]HQB31909.1 hypothetical protein [Erysipelotrichaceae bacterium]